MNRTELIAKIKSKIVIDPKLAKAYQKAFEESVAEALADGDEVVLVGFGTFKVTARKSRLGRNPQTGETLKIAAKKAPTFKAGKLLKETVN